MNFTMITNPIFAWLNHKRLPRKVPLSHFERICEEIKPCDVILIEGRTRVSEVIKLITQSPWSHAALYIGCIDDIKNPKLKKLIKRHYSGSENEQLIIESELGMGTVIREFDTYKQEHMRICRPSELADSDAQDIIRYALSCIGYSYDVRQILDLARFLFPWKILPRRWRSSLFNHNAGDTTKTVCSTMIAECFNFVQFPILPLAQSDKDNNLSLYRRNPKLCVPRDFDYSPYFDIIKYPFVDYTEHKGYKELPWRGDFDSELKNLNTNIEAICEEDITDTKKPDNLPGLDKITKH